MTQSVRSVMISVHAKYEDVELVSDMIMPHSNYELAGMTVGGASMRSPGTSNRACVTLQCDCQPAYERRLLKHYDGSMGNGSLFNIRKSSSGQTARFSLITNQIADLAVP